MTLQDAKILAAEIFRLGYKPNDWEALFLASIERLSMKPTTMQSKKLEEIYRKAAGGGCYVRKQL